MLKIAIVTGASKGIGKEIAIALAKKKHHVIALARTKDKLDELQYKYRDHIHSIAMDLTLKSDRNKIVKYIKSEALKIDILINNAGGLINKPFMELTDKDWNYLLDINLISTLQLTKALVPFMKDKSHIVNISSMGGFQGSSKFPGLTGYSVAKGAVSILSECLAAEFTDRNINVNALCLGSVKTEMFHTAFPDFTADVTPADMGTYIADFALNGSTFYNGKVLPVALQNPS